MKFLVIFLLFCFSSAEANIGDDILKHYQARLYRLPFVQQEHFSLRMYTITGDERYLNPMIMYLYLLSNKYRALTPNLDKDNLLEEENRRLLSINEFDTDKKKMRMKKIEQFPGVAFYMNYLILIKKIYFYKLDKTPLFPNIDQAIRYLKANESRFEPFLLDDENIVLYGAQLVNYVYYLLDLGIVDLRDPYSKKFRQIFPDSQDGQLSSLDYAAKIYGMTHFIIAASNYYQTRVDDPTLNWITEYFETHIDEIIKRSENDVIAEVGVCLMLLSREHSVAVAKIKAHLNKAYDPRHGFIPDKEQYFDLSRGEHRNILTIMLFKWPEKLTPIPQTLIQKILSRGFVIDDNNMEINFGFKLI
ncbi:DUF3541 domain-containing protein [Legionella sp. CNM-4043-24]|uniref:DUF3541 domain-containing protein n=1 Tax=Legionella sp. CNM-4043-24 TaxID=3421646 RepID=UPI00403B2A1B